MTERQTKAPRKRVIQNMETGKYYAAPGRWVSEIEAAKDFESICAMLEEVSQGHLPRGKCMLILCFERKELDVQLPL